MFEALSDKLASVFQKLGRKGRLTERDVDFVREFRRLDTRAQREVWEFIRFKLQGAEGPEAQPESDSSPQNNGPDE